MNDDKAVHDDLKKLANGVHFAIASLNKGTPLDFLLILVRPNDDDDTITLNTITGITDPSKIAQIGRHLTDMAIAQGGHQLDPDDDSEVRGHA